MNLSNIYLLNVPIENDYKHTLYFANKKAQHTYFQSKIVYNFTNVTYQRKDNKIRINKKYDDLYNCNYVMYQNTSYSNKWFYAFITNIEYVSDGLSDIYIETDVMQTWAFDYIIKTSFIEREHVNNDTTGLHTIPEDLEHGEYICNSHVIDDAMDNIMSKLMYVVSTTLDLSSSSPSSSNKFNQAGVRKYNGITSGCVYYPLFSASDISTVLNAVAEKGQIDGINGLFMAPKIFLGSATGPEMPESNSATSYNNTISKQTTLQGYSPRNKKLLCYPYNYLLVSNNNGNSNILNYEDFSGSCTFTIDMAITPGCSIRMVPTNYKGVTRNDEYGINMGKLPICNYPVDMYTNWLTQNSINIGGHLKTTDDINIGVSGANMLMGFGGSVASGNVGGAMSSVVNGLGNIANSMITKKQHELIPPEARGNLNCGDVITSSGKNNFHFYKMSIKQEYAKIIDSFFDVFGYKVNEVKIPNKNHRENYWYTKTIDINITGGIPMNDLQTIKNVYNNGITFWKNPANIKDYSVSNNIV